MYGVVYGHIHQYAVNLYTYTPIYADFVSPYTPI